MSATDSTDDDVLGYTQGLRRRFVDALTENGAKIPTDKDNAMLMLGALDSMDRAALGNKRLKVDKNIGDAVVQGTALVAQLFTKLGTVSPFISDKSDRVGLPHHPDVLAENVVIVPGELDTSLHSQTYDEFMSANKPAKGT